MILVRGPFRVFDVDVLGVTVLLALAVGVYLAAVVPGRVQAQQRHELAVALDEIEGQVGAAEHELARLRRLTDELETALTERSNRVPRRSDFNTIVNQVVGAAEAAGMEVSSVVPSPVEAVEEHFVGRVGMVGQGTARTFVRFLDALAERHASHAIESYSLVKQEGGSAGVCTITVAVRVHMLPDEQSPAAAEAG